jgi:hypothetical protein
MRKTLCWIACVWLADAGIAGSPGYLARVGPVPLRFLSVPNAAAKDALPPLDLGGPLPPEEVATTNHPIAGLAPKRPVDTHSLATPLPPPAQPPDDRSLTTPPGTVALPPPGTAPPDVANPAGPTADKFVRFFMPVPMGTNGIGYVTAPVIFTPPGPVNATPVSRATYQTPPN